MSSPSAVVVRGRGQTLPGPVPGAVGIGASVGLGGANRADDVRAVQLALNHVPVTLGGAGDSLAVDGICGPLTMGAIADFQRRWLTICDSRCDPRGPTLALLNAMTGVGDAMPVGTTGALVAFAAGDVKEVVPLASKPGAAANASPTAPKPAKPKAPRMPSPQEVAAVRAAERRQSFVERLHMGVAADWLLNALRMLNAAAEHVKRLQRLPSGGMILEVDRDDPNRLAFLVVAKTFKLHESKVAAAAAAVAFIDDILRRSLMTLKMRLPARPPVPSPAPDVPAPLFISLFGIPRVHHPNTLAYAPQGGFHLKPGPDVGVTNAFIRPGVVLPERNDRIYLTPEFDKTNFNNQRLTIIHELAHWVSAPSGAKSVPEIATVDDHPKWKALNSQQRLHTADSYGFFATECGIGTDKAVEDSGSSFTAIPRFPVVKTASLQATRTIFIPSSGTKGFGNFDYPAGAAF